VDEFFANSLAWASVLCYAAAAFGCVYALVAIWAVRGFVRPAAAQAPSYPPVTILKPLHGTQPNLYADLAGFCAQDYPAAVQIVFGVDDPDDPAIAVVHRLAANFPDRDLSLVVNALRHGENRKVSNLINMVGAARHQILVVSDSDISVAPDYLADVVAGLQQPGVGLVTCPYYGKPAAGIWARLAAGAVNYHFLPNVLVGLKFGLARPCFGSTMALRKSTLATIGGFEAVVDQLADDYVLGALVRRAGLAVCVLNRAVAHDCVESSARQLLRHEVRWARTIRCVEPLGYLGLGVTHPLPLALLGLAFGGLGPAALIAVAAVACRLALQSEIDHAFDLHDDSFWLEPLRDILSFVIFVMSYCGRDVEWGGHRYGLRADNSLAYYGEVET